ncbi:MAG: methyl-accepting chemotaxis protein [Peptostreptococcaceae bacterium]
MKVSKKLTLSFASVLVCSYIIGASGYAGVRDISISNNKYTNEAIKSVLLIKDIQEEIVEIGFIKRELLFDSNVPYLQGLITQNQESIQKELSSLKTIYTNETLLKNYEGTLNEFNLLVNEIISKSNDKAVIYDLIQNNSGDITQRLYDAGKAIEDDSFDYATSLYAENRQIVSTTIQRIFVLTTSAIAIGFVLSRKITRGIIQPVNEISKLCENLSRGEFSDRVEYNIDDEIGNMAQLLNGTMDILQSQIEEVDLSLGRMADKDFGFKVSNSFVGDFKSIENSLKSLNKEMSQILGDIDDVSQNVSKGSNYLSLNSNNLAQASTNQETSVEDLRSSIGSMKDDIAENERKFKTINSLLNDNQKNLTTSEVNVKEMEVAMNDILTKSREIKKIVKTIDDIAFQTNILALNASVEASRAGQYGKGFAVVADEVRSLAQKTTKASKDTTALIEETVYLVDSGYDISKRTTKSISSIINNSFNSNELIDEITDANKIQFNNIKEINNNIEEITKVVALNSQSAEKMNGTSAELDNESKILNDLTSQFKTTQNYSYDEHEAEEEEDIVEKKPPVRRNGMVENNKARANKKKDINKRY